MQPPFQKQATVGDRGRSLKINMHTQIKAKWEQLGGTSSFLGNPTGSVGECPDRAGAFAHFKNGSIHWHSDTGAFETHGAINKTFSELEWERGILGYPTSDEREISEREIFMLTHVVYGDGGAGYYECNNEKQKRRALAEEMMKERYPTTDPLYQLSSNPTSGRITFFQKGAIAYTVSTSSIKILIKSENRGLSLSDYSEYISPSDRRYWGF